MQATRKARIETAILHELSVIIARGLKDPRIPALTLTSVQLSPDASQATVYFTVFGSSLDESPESSKQARAAVEGLTSAAGFLRRELAREITVRHIPSLVFKEDRGLANAQRVQELLGQISAEHGKKS